MSTPQTTVDVAPPSAREMMRMTLGLTVVCLLASMILGGFYLWTEPAKARNVAAREQQLIRQLLELTPSAEVQEIRRYLLWRGSQLEIFYMTPRQLIQFDANGDLLGTNEVPEAVRETSAPAEKDNWVEANSGATDGDDFRYVGRFFSGIEADKVAGYIIEGEIPGFKTWIRFFVAINSDYSLRGIEIIEHEEDPGLGDQITEPYFKNQYAGREFDAIRDIKVTKDPLPKDWEDAVTMLGGDLGFSEWITRYADELPSHPDIHAITGATISSVAVTDGVKRALGNFRKRMNLVENYL